LISFDVFRKRVSHFICIGFDSLESLGMSFQRFLIINFIELILFVRSLKKWWLIFGEVGIWIGI